MELEARNMNPQRISIARVPQVIVQCPNLSNYSKLHGVAGVSHVCVSQGTPMTESSARGDCQIGWKAEQNTKKCHVQHHLVPQLHIQF